jgi:hypothetical protein
MIMNSNGGGTDYLPSSIFALDAIAAAAALTATPPAEETGGGMIKTAAVITKVSPNACSPLVDGNKTNQFDNIYKRGLWGAKKLEIDAFYNEANWPPKKVKSASGGGSDLGRATVTSLRIIKEAIAE